MDAPEVDNRTDYALHPQVLVDRDGERLVAIVKATFELVDGDLELASEARMRGIRPGDVPWDPEIPASIAYPADLAIRKPGTDVAVLASAHAPGGRPAPRVDVCVEIGPVKRALVVFGPRVWLDDGLGLSQPEPMLELDLKWDHAYGGFDDSGDEPYEEPYNPVGSGHVREAKVLSQKPTPRIEDPVDLLKSRDSRPKPAGIAPLGRSFEPRRSFAGTYDEAWLENRAPLLPDDYDDRNACFAPRELLCERGLRGGEPVRLLNLTPGGGAVTFTLPAIALEIGWFVAGREPFVERPRLDTVFIDAWMVSPDKPLAVELSWRSSVKAPRRQREARIVLREVRS